MVRRLIPALLLMVAACSDSGGDLVSPGTGSLEITTSTTGETTSAGYTVTVDGGTAEAIGVNGSLHRADVDAGEHTVLLAGMPDGCAVSGENPRTVSVAAGATAAVTFSVSCLPSDGRIDVITSTSGPGPESYSLLVDGAAGGAIGSSTTRSVEGLALGSHSIGLSDLPATCQLQGDNPQTVTVDAAAAAVVTFTVACSAPPAQTGAVKIITTTSGGDLDPDGYQVAIAGSSSQPIPTSGSITVTGLAAGTQAVQLSGLAANCSVTGENPRSVTVAAGATAEMTFTMACSATSGSVRITTSTSGSSPDAGYTFQVDDRPAQAIGGSASATVTGLPAGSHSVRLADVAGNCTVGGENPRNVTVTAGATTDVAFAVTCTTSSTNGSIRIVTATSGTSPDPDGYTYKIDNGSPVAIGASASATVNDIPAGSHTVLLEGVASNCTVGGTNPMTVSVTAGNTAEASFAVSCAGSNAQQWTAMVSNTDEDLLGVWAASGSNAFAVSAGSIFHLTGGSWSRQASAPDGASLRYIWGSSPNDVFAVGAGAEGGTFKDGVILHSNGSGWTAMQPPSVGTEIAQGFYGSVWGSSSTDVYAVGDAYLGFTQALIAHFDGSSWTRVRLPYEDEHSLRDVYGTSPTDVWVGGVIVGPSDGGPGYGFAFHYNGSDWSYHIIYEEFGLRGVWASSPTDVFAVGQVGFRAAVFHYDGTAWTRMPVPDTGALNDVWGSSATDVYAAGDNGILHYDGTAWSAVATTGSLQDIWGASANDIFAVGGSGRIYYGPR